MGLFIETGTGKTRYFGNIIDFLEATEDGFQKITAENIGRTIDPAKSGGIGAADEDDVEIEGLPALPEEGTEYSFWK